ncbi:MAG: Chitinase II [Parcubacteria group bacterium Gr01-1014_31]|nr:MAG: Chitinase II [Parcubacteria group bacterium Gr01-1014_31]
MRQVAVRTKTREATETSLIVSQVIIAAALAVPLGVFAAALGVISARNNSGQVRIAYYATVTPTPSPSPTPVPVLATPGNFGVSSVGTTHAVLQWDAVAGATEYRVYNSGSVFETFVPVASGFYGLNYLSVGTTYLLQVAAMGADGTTSKKSGSKTVTTPPLVVTCVKSKTIVGDATRTVPQCSANNNTAICTEAQVTLATEMQKFTCANPCKRYYKPKPPKTDTPTCVDIPPEVVALLGEWLGFDVTGHKINSCRASVEAFCVKDVANTPEGAVPY